MSMSGSSVFDEDQLLAADMASSTPGSEIVARSGLPSGSQNPQEPETIASSMDNSSALLRDENLEKTKTVSVNLVSLDPRLLHLNQKEHERQIADLLAELGSAGQPYEEEINTAPTTHKFYPGRVLVGKKDGQKVWAYLAQASSTTETGLVFFHEKDPFFEPRDERFRLDYEPWCLLIQSENYAAGSQESWLDRARSIIELVMLDAGHFDGPLKTSKDKNKASHSFRSILQAIRRNTTSPTEPRNIRIEYCETFSHNTSNEEFEHKLEEQAADFIKELQSMIPKSIWFQTEFFQTMPGSFNRGKVLLGRIRSSPRPRLWASTTNESHPKMYCFVDYQQRFLRFCLPETLSDTVDFEPVFKLLANNESLRAKGKLQDHVRILVRLALIQAKFYNPKYFCDEDVRFASSVLNLMKQNLFVSKGLDHAEPQVASPSTAASAFELRELSCIAVGTEQEDQSVAADMALTSSSSASPEGSRLSSERQTLEQPDSGPMSSEDFPKSSDNESANRSDKIDTGLVNVNISTLIQRRLEFGREISQLQEALGQDAWPKEEPIRRSFPCKRVFYPGRVLLGKRYDREVWIYVIQVNKRGNVELRYSYDDCTLLELRVQISGVEYQPWCQLIANDQYPVGSGMWLTRAKSVIKLRMLDAGHFDGKLGFAKPSYKSPASLKSIIRVIAAKCGSSVRPRDTSGKDNSLSSNSACGTKLRFEPEGLSASCLQFLRAKVPNIWFAVECHHSIRGTLLGRKVLLGRMRHNPKQYVWASTMINNPRCITVYFKDENDWDQVEYSNDWSDIVIFEPVFRLLATNGLQGSRQFSTHVAILVRLALIDDCSYDPKEFERSDDTAARAAIEIMEKNLSNEPPKPTPIVIDLDELETLTNSSTTSINSADDTRASRIAAQQERTLSEPYHRQPISEVYEDSDSNRDSALPQNLDLYEAPEPRGRKRRRSASLEAGREHTAQTLLIDPEPRTANNASAQRDVDDPAPSLVREHRHPMKHNEAQRLQDVVWDNILVRENNLRAQLIQIKGRADPDSGLGREHQELRTEITALKSELAQAKSDIASKESTIEERNDELEFWDGECRDMTKELDTLRDFEKKARPILTLLETECAEADKATRFTNLKRLCKRTFSTRARGGRDEERSVDEGMQD